MKKNLIIAFFILLISANMFSQTDMMDCYAFAEQDNTAYIGLNMSPTNTTTDYYDSRNGAYFPTTGTFRVLTIFVNVIYDVTPNIDPFPNSASPVWASSTVEGININPPSYMSNLYDVNIQPSGIYNGSATRLYAESSFNNLILLSDFIVVNIKQSQITITSTSESGKLKDLLTSVVSYINNHGGFQTYYGHNLLSDYDKITAGSFGLSKTIQPDGKIDLACF
jgi:hypothetical protein